MCWLEHPTLKFWRCGHVIYRPVVDTIHWYPEAGIRGSVCQVINNTSQGSSHARTVCPEYLEKKKKPERKKDDEGSGGGVTSMGSSTTGSTVAVGA